MSNDVRSYQQERDGKPLHVTAFVGGTELGKALQFTIGDEYAELSEQQIEDLLEVIAGRYKGEINGTGPEEHIIIKSNGEPFEYED